MRPLISFLAATVAAVAFGAGVATAGDAVQPFHGGSCQAVSETRTVCFEAWGVFKQKESGDLIDLFQRRFTDYTNGVLTFEQRDLTHHIVSGGGRVSIDLFAGSSTPSGLTCRWHEQVVVVNGEVVHSVDQLSCS